jgi:hypothetical protein
MQPTVPEQRDDDSNKTNLPFKNVVIVLLLLCLALTRTPDLRNLTAVTNSEEMMLPVVSKRQGLADGCYNVFVDVGANIGVHTRFMYEPLKYPKADSASIFNTHFGTGNERDNRDFCAFGFEPNPEHKQRHLKLQAVYKAMGWKYYPIIAGVSDQAGNLTFYHMNDEAQKEWGFNAIQPQVGGEEKDLVTVPVVRLAEFLMDEIRDREMPSTVYGKYPRGPRVIMKMDIEGMEYVTLPDLVASGALCTTVDFCFGEFHSHDYFFPMNRTETHGGLYLKNAKQALEFSAELVRVLHSAQNCKTEYSTLDDESYLTDGKSFPKPIFNNSV